MLTTAQRAVLKADILADPVLSAYPNNDDGHIEIAKAYALDSASVNVWRTDAPVAAIYDAIDWTKYTPTDAPDNTATFTNRLLAVQTKQMNLQNMLQGRVSIDASKANVRAGLRDAVIQLPTGAAGAATAAGGSNGVNVLNACVRKAKRGEALFATTQATTGTVTANLLVVVQDDITLEDVREARNS